MPSNNIYCVLKDSYGILWIGTENGLVKYDGFQYTIYQTKDGLIGNLIWDIQEDKNHHLWISCYNKGLSKFDRSKFTNYTKKEGLVDEKIRRLFFDHQGDLYIGTNRGLSVLHQGKFYNYVTPNTTGFDEFQIMNFWEKKGVVYFYSRTHSLHQVKLLKHQLTVKNLNNRYEQIHLNVFIGTYFAPLSDSSAILSLAKLVYYHKKNNTHRIDSVGNFLVWNIAKTPLGHFLASDNIYGKDGGLYLLKHDKILKENDIYGIRSTKVWNVYYDEKSDNLYVCTSDKGLYQVQLNHTFPYFKHQNVVDVVINGSQKVVLTNDHVKFYKRNSMTLKINIDDMAQTLIQKFNLKIKGSDTEFTKFMPYQMKYDRHKYYISFHFGLVVLNEEGKIVDFIHTALHEFQICAENSIIGNFPYMHFATCIKKGRNWNLKTYYPNQKKSNYFVSSSAKLDSHYFFVDKTHGVFQGTLNTEFTACKTINDYPNKWILVKSSGDLVYFVSDEGAIFAFKMVNHKLLLVKKWDRRHYIGQSILSLEVYKKQLFILTNQGLNRLKGGKNQFYNAEQSLLLGDFLHTKCVDNQLLIIQKSGYFQINLDDFETPSLAVQRVKINRVQYFDNHQWHELSKNELTKNEQEFSYLQNKLNFTFELNEIDHPKKIHLYYSFNQKDWTPMTQLSLDLQSLTSGKYTLYIKQIDQLSGTIDVFPIYRFAIDKPFWQKGWFIFMMSALSIGLLIFMVKKRNEKLDQQKKREALIQRRIAETKLEALQSQMNPHFIFNALTAIQSYILDEDVDNSLSYLNDFALLMRQTLNFSSKTSISLREEKDYLERFVKIENLRFGNQVKYTFTADSINLEHVHIPPMLIQPLIENAFEHGFTQRKKAYDLRVQIALQEGGILSIEVKDSGEGFQNTYTTPHESKALKIIQERLELLFPTFNPQLDFLREDNWTLVRFQIPMQDATPNVRSN